MLFLKVANFSLSACIKSKLFESGLRKCVAAAGAFDKSFGCRITWCAVDALLSWLVN